MVYVDDMNAKYRRMIMSHMIADSQEELITMAISIGVNPKWIQDKDTYKEHFDVCLEMKAKAIVLGAIPVTWKELGMMIVKRKPDHNLINNSK